MDKLFSDILCEYISASGLTLNQDVCWFQKDEQIIKEGEHSARALMIFEGCVKGVSRNFTSSFWGPGYSLLLPEMISDSPAPEEYIALQKTRCYVLHKKTVEKAMKSNDKFRSAVSTYITNEYNHKQEMSELCKHARADVLVSKFLKMYVKRLGTNSKGYMPAISRKDIGHYLGISKNTLNLLLDSMQSSRKVSIKKNRIRPVV